MKKSPDPKVIKRSPAEIEAEKIRKKMGHLDYELLAKLWLDTGSKLLNGTLGSEELGLAYGKMYELSGPESHGKSLLAALLLSLAQEDGADGHWVDLENSLDKNWTTGQGVNWDTLYRSYPRLVKSSSKPNAKPRLQTAEEICDEVELWMERRHKQGSKKMFIVVDSVTAFLVEEEAAAGNTEQNMRTKVALASFLSRLLRRWCALAQAYNASIVFINQLRMTPGGYGNPEQTTGGKALRFYCSVRAGVRRVKGGRMLQKGRMVGLKGVIRNMKNKSGGGSVEGMECGFKASFKDRDWRFLPAKKLRGEEAGEE
jgi:recombination protein RecA